MGEVDRIREQMKRAYEGDAWHGPSVQEVLDGVSAQSAAKKPIADAHSIWEITLHIATWKDVVARRLKGEGVLEVPPEEDFPPVRATGAQAWEQARERLEAAHERLLEALSEVKDDQLDQIPPKGRTARYVLLHGVIQHDLYHAGQIAILRKG